jgi:hypothetical protein
MRFRLDRTHSDSRPPLVSVAALAAAALFFFFFTLPGSAASAAAGPPATATFWLPSPAPLDDLRGRANLYFDGMDGRVLRADSGLTAVIESRGGERIDVAGEEVLYVYLVEDAGKAEFDPPARVLARAGHEVLVATPGEAPRLTAAADLVLHGLKQPVRLPSSPVPWPAQSVVVPSAPRDADPMVQQIVNSITTGTYQPGWQTLDDFETRYAYTSQNLAASQWILDRFHSYGLSAAFHFFQDSGTRRNVIATLPGVVDPSRVVYICSHFDATSPTPNTCAPGADDNGSGTEAVLEAARVMSQYLFQYTIKFACFNEEEQGLVGSAAYVNDIAQQGENVIAVYDADMIAYRGTDPAPPDLVIYSNSASQSIATTLADAANTYAPGQLEPIIHVEALEGSDYASFWHHNYKAVCGIEDEAWGSDFCPWYHTCNDRIEQYPQDYVLYCTRAMVAATAITAMPLNPSGPFLVLGSTLVDDDMSGGSQGNGDGVLNPGETIELYATVRNVGGATATHVHGTLSSGSGDVTLLTPNANWPDIVAGGQGTNLTALRFRLSGTVADGTTLPFTLTMTDDTGNRALAVEFVVSAPRLSYYSHSLDEVSGGNGNGVIDPGESIFLPVTLFNTGGQTAVGVQGLMTSDNPHVFVAQETAGCSQVPSGGEAELVPPFQVIVSSEAAVGEVLTLNLALTAGSGYEAASTFNIKVGTNYYYEAEADGPWSLAAGDDNATTGRWVRVDPNGTVYNGQQCQPEDDHTAAPGVACFVTGQGSVGGAAGENDLDGGKTTLTTPVLDITRVADPRLTYWRWYTNNLGNNPNEDYWVVQISSNGGGSWVDLERTTSSGNSWQEKSFPLAGVITPSNNVRVRFVAEDAGTNALIEAAVDDIEISGTTTSVAVGGNGAPLTLRLDPARPSPSASGTILSFALPAASPVTLRLFGVDGRLVRTLVDARVDAGIHQAVWNGRNEAGAEAAPGVYFCRLRAGEKTLTQRLVLVR